ncbi:MAG: 4Fe-4S binding protein [Deltaproteobacteria bacterium]|nr:MAG: 4Fe-4S binding protein [Deltaproteobacteria bacterium]
MTVTNMTHPARECDCRHEPQGCAADRKERRIQAGRAQRTRRLKQLILGTAFLGLLGAGWLYPLIGYFIPACMLLGIGLAAFRGRNWCDWLCPRGSFEDGLLARISPQRRIPQVFRGTPLRVGVMGLLMTVLTLQIVRLWPDAWAIGGAFVLLLSITTGVGVVLGLIFQQRTWCYICPIGTMSNWVGKNRRPLLLAAERCTECNLCAKACPMQLTPAAIKGLGVMPHRGDCLKCSLCVGNCPTGALAFQDNHIDRAAA